MQQFVRNPTLTPTLSSFHWNVAIIYYWKLFEKKRIAAMNQA